MSNRPTLKLPSKSVTPTKTEDNIKQEAIKNRREKNKKAFETLKSFNLKMPLATGIGRELRIKIKAEGHGHIATRKAMGRLINSKNYLKLVINSKWRYDLNGNEVEEVTSEQKEYSRELLKTRYNLEY